MPPFEGKVMQVRKVGRDWVSRCQLHSHRVTTDNWHDAYEAAAGHLVMVAH